MKTMKELFLEVFSVALFATLLALPFATPAYAESGSYVFDEMGVLSTSQFQTLEQKGAQYAQDYGVGVYLLYTDYMNGNSNPSESQRNEFARQYFLSNGLGVGANKNGIIVVVAVQSRDYVTVKHFNDSSEDPFSDSGVDALEEDYTSYLSNNNWYGAADSYYSTVGEQLQFFANTGKQWTESNPFTLVLKILATLGIPALIAGGSVRRDKNAMLTAREKSEASNYLERESVNLTVATDDFVNTTLAVVPIPKEEKSGGGGWSDMGGGFSGSGGGKF